jgi:uncharacterized iron-regulated membrane protein
METTITALLALAFFAGAGLAAWAERRPRKSLDVPLLPLTPVMFLCVMGGMFAAAHLISLLGLKN